MLEISEKEWKEKLTPEQFSILRQKGTEYPYSGKYNFFNQDGIYKCAGCGSRLFDSAKKLRSFCGWPSFSDALENSVIFRRDESDAQSRIEVLCANCGGHLGHIFDDGLSPNRSRYCINSLALQFEPRNETYSGNTSINLE